MNENTINNDVTIAGQTSVLAGRYCILKQLGAGGMGSVWLAEDTQLDNKLYAIKMLPSILVSNKRAYNQLKSEALVAMKLVHPNIVQIRAFEENNGNPFLVMDYIDGETLDDWLGDRSQELGVNEEEVVRLLRPIAEALDYAHTEGVVHRDVKPANVMIRKDGRPFIMDFGIAREIQETLTRVTGKLSSGTLLYMSPEQLNGDMPKKEQDIYSFAAMVYECLKGEPPFCRGAIEDQIKNKTPEVLGDDITVASSVMAALAKKPEDRPKTCADVLIVNSNTLQSSSKNREGEHPCEMRVGRGAHAAPQIEELSSRAPQSNKGPSEIGNRGGWKLFGAIVFLGFVVYLGMQYRNNFSDWFSDASPIDLPPKPPQPPLPPEKPKGPTEADVADIMVEATVKKNQLQRIDDGDGFERRKAGLSDLLTKATSYGKAKQWNKAAFNFTNYVDGCNKLLTLDGERKITKEKHSAAVASQLQAEKVESSKYASARWSAALDVMKNANEHFSQMEFSEAKRFYESAANQFELCVSEAKTERERQEKEQVRRAKWRKEGEPYTIEPEGLNLTMKWCPAGSFVMGSPASEEGRRGDETQCKVTITKGYWLGETEVTQGQWKRIMGGETVEDMARAALYDDSEYNFGKKNMTLREFWNLDRNYNPKNLCGDVCDDIPIYNVSKNQAIKFCFRLTEFERKNNLIPDGYEYRLPTEAEWEYACRAGTTTALPNNQDLYVNANINTEALNRIAWYAGNSYVGFNGRGVRKWPLAGGKIASARSVKQKVPNNWGFYDMLGNVWELCLDCKKVDNDVGYGIRRGGGWKTNAEWCQSTTRSRVPSFIPLSDTGFRIALAPSHLGMTYPEAPAIIVPKVDEKEKNFRLAKEAFNAKRYDEAYRLFMKSDLEDREVQWYLGRMYAYGQGVPKNEYEAVKWYRKAAEQGHSSAQNNLGVIYENGDGVAKNDYEAVKWYRESAEQGSAIAQCSLGNMYKNGKGVAKDDYEAVKWYRKASDQGHPIGHERLGLMYVLGRGVEKNDYEAIRLFRLAAGEFAPAQYSLGWMYENGRGCAKDLEMAKQCYEKAASKGVKEAKEALERLANVKVVQPAGYVQIVNQPQQPVLIDRPSNLKYCDNCGHELWRYKKISPRCEKCGTILFKPEETKKNPTGINQGTADSIRTWGSIMSGIGGIL